MKTSFPIVGMHCASCAHNIKEKLLTVPGVVAADVNYGSEEATVDFDDTKTGLPQIADAVKDVGYTAITEGKKEKTPEELKEEAKKAELADLKNKTIISAFLSDIVLLGSFPQGFSFLFFLPF